MPSERKSSATLRLKAQRVDGFFAAPDSLAPLASLACVALLALCAAVPANAVQAPPDSDGLKAALAVPTTAMVSAHVEFLADDLLEGRAPGTRGAALAARYIRSQFQEAGLEPGAPNGTFFQSVRLVGVTPSPSFVIGVGQRTMALQYLKDFVAWPDGPESSLIADGEIVFVGYGIQAPEWQWNDYVGATMTGKVVMMLVNDPGLRDSTIFDGREMTSYGHWTYKLEQAARSGAVGAILIHSVESAASPWPAVRNTWSGEQIQLEGRPTRTLRFGAWVSEESARRVIGMAGIDYDLLMRRALRRDFRPIPIGAHAVVDIISEVRSVESANVIARLGTTAEGEEEAVVLMSHYDHHGIRSSGGIDSIYNGAVDNASGVAALLVSAAGLARAGAPSHRSIYFVATTGEEAGYLGAEMYLRIPPVPAARTAAVINIDRANLWGATSDIVALGAHRSTLTAAVVAATEAERLVLSPDPNPEAGDYFGSDHVPFARAGIPALLIGSGENFVGQPSDWGGRRAEEYLSTAYHQPTDITRPDFRYEGLLQQVAVMMRIGWALAETGEFPSWNPDSEFSEADERRRAGR